MPNEVEISVEAAQAILEEGDPVLSFICSNEVAFNTANGWKVRIEAVSTGNNVPVMKYHLSKSE